MVQLIPGQPQFANTSEQEVWERLRDGLGPDDVLLANLRLTDEVKDHEADLVVLMPDVGCLVLEVKGRSLWFADSNWWIKRGGTRSSTRWTRRATRSSPCVSTSSGTRAGAAGSTWPGRTES
jgi:hypothetical protein